MAGTDTEIKGELHQLCQICEKAMETCAHQLSELGHFRRSWHDWDDSMTAVGDLMKILEKKVGQLEFQRQNGGRVATSGPVDCPSVQVKQ